MAQFYESHEDFSASSWLSTFAGTLYNEFLDYWEQQNVEDAESELSPEQRESVRGLIRMADALRPLVHSLSVDPKSLDSIDVVFRRLGGAGELDTQRAVSVAHTLTGHPVINHAIQIQLAQEAGGALLKGGERRFADLIALIADRSLNERSAAYLDRATRLYLWGFEPETVVMSAAAVEAAYEACIAPARMIKHQLTKKGTRFEVWQYEHAAVLEKLYSAGDQKAANDLREARNDVVHNVPAVALTGLQALRVACDLLNKLSKPSNRP